MNTINVLNSILKSPPGAFQKFHSGAFARNSKDLFSLFRLSGKVLFLFFFCTLVSCGGSSADEAYRNLALYAKQTSASNSTSDLSIRRKPAGKFGNIILLNEELNYVLDNNRSLDHEALQEMSAALRSLVIKKQLLRRRIIELGMQAGIYDTPEAARFLLPRLEKILEDYYFSKKGDFAKIEKRVQALDIPGENLDEILQSKQNDGGKLNKAKLVSAKNKLLLKLRLAEEAKARQKIIQDILKNSPPLEVLK